MQKADGPKKMFHVVVGTPDEDNCPICRAHAVGKGDQGSDGASGPILIQELTLTDILRCSCPLCKEARQSSLGE